MTAPGKRRANSAKRPTKQQSRRHPGPTERRSWTRRDRWTAALVARAILIESYHGQRSCRGTAGDNGATRTTKEERAMATKQGSLTLLEDPVAQRLLQSTIPARL